MATTTTTGDDDDNSNRSNQFGITIEPLDTSPAALRRKLPTLSESSDNSTPSPDATWPRMKSSPRRARKEKDVFKFLKESDANYTVRRQQLQMNLILEKNKDVKQVCFVGVVDVKPPVLLVMHIILCLVLSLMSPFPLPPPAQRIEFLMDVELSADIGEWVVDGGVMFCELINKLHPSTIHTVHRPSGPGLVSLALGI